MEAVSLDATRVGAARRLLARAEPALRRAARRFSLCDDDADDAFQRSVEILLTKAPPIPQRALAAWMRTVTRREALALRRARESLLDHDAFQPDALIGDHPGPLERCERRERLRRARRLLAALKADERRAIVLQASGYSYAEICRITGWTYTKVNRCLAEGRARLRELSLVA